MATADEVAAQNAAQVTVAAAAWAQFQTGWDALGLTAPTLTSDTAVTAVQDLFADVVAVWGEVAGSVAADYYESLREQADVPGSYDALVRDPLNVAQVERLTITKLRVNAVEPHPSPEAALAALEGSVERLIRQAQRTTLNDAAAQDPARARVARIPTGDNPCAFCLVMGSRGYRYRSLSSAGQTAALPLYENRFHDDCGCALDISWDTNPEPPDGYDPGALYERYSDARKAAGSGDLRKILAEMRKADDTH